MGFLWLKKATKYLIKSYKREILRTNLLRAAEYDVQSTVHRWAILPTSATQIEKDSR